MDFPQWYAKGYICLRMQRVIFVLVCNEKMRCICNWFVILLYLSFKWGACLIVPNTSEEFLVQVINISHWKAYFLGCCKTCFMCFGIHVVVQNHTVLSLLYIERMCNQVVE